MPRPDKVEAVKKIAADLKAADIYYFVDYRGLTFGEATELRARLAKVDASLKVIKNTLANTPKSGVFLTNGSMRSQPAQFTAEQWPHPATARSGYARLRVSLTASVMVSANRQGRWRLT